MKYIKLKGKERFLIETPNLIAQPDYSDTIQQGVLTDFFSFKTTSISFEEAKKLLIKENLISFDLLEDEQPIQTFNDFTVVSRISNCFNSLNNEIEIVVKKPLEI